MIELDAGALTLLALGTSFIAFGIRFERMSVIVGLACVGIALQRARRARR